MTQACDKRMQKQKHVWHQIMHVLACEINTPHNGTYTNEVSATKQSSLQPVVP